MISRFLPFLTAVFLVALCGTSPAADWGRTRDAAMDLRERGNHRAAYDLAARFAPSNPRDAFDAEFVSGWLALRFMQRPDLALTHFTRMAGQAPLQKSHARSLSKAQAGYWLGRALSALGRAPDARTMYSAAMAYPNTFYGQLSAAEMKVDLQKTAIAGIASSYPSLPLRWHDARARKELVLAIIKEESAFRQSVTSGKGAKGLMQVMPGTARHVGRAAGVDINLEMMRSNPDYNVAVGSKYLADQIERYRGNAMLAAAAYNAGPVRVDEWLSRFGDPRGGATDPVDWIESIPFRETRDYVKKVIGSYITYMALAER